MAQVFRFRETDEAERKWVGRIDKSVSTENLHKMHKGVT